MLSQAMLSQSMPLTMLATQDQLQQTDALQASTIQQQMQSQQQLNGMQQWSIQQDTETKTFQMMQEVTVQRAKTADKINEKWLSIIKD